MAERQPSLFNITPDGLISPNRSSPPGKPAEGPPVVADAPPASMAAARSVAESTENMRRRVLDYIAARDVHGATCDEVEIALGMSHQTASARIWELRIRLLIRDSGQTRKTRTGRSATVHWAASVRPPSMPTGRSEGDA